MKSKLIQDLITESTKVWPLPSFADEAAVTKWILDLTAGAIAIVYDCVGTDATKLAALRAELEANPITAEEVHAEFAKMHAEGCFAAMPQAQQGAIGDWIKKLPWATILQGIITLLMTLK